ncbi:opsin 9 [Denticeps clupeoides]|uniref:G-protein coupled receptors family 1 profile domain-containing protein n=1 Tax=Denticeps clupeoides TaxID=299321 RepID=A0AAY4AGH9_9TELE|nr:opsin-5-like [Denticeps clupeoides]
MSTGANNTWRWFLSAPSSVPPYFHSQLSFSADLSVAIFLIMTGIVSVVGNGVVLLIFWRKRKKLRPHELMTINLAICDFGYSLLGAPCPITSSLSHAWIFGERGCLFYGLQGFLFGIGSLLTTCLISLDRCFKICSVQYGQWIERKHASISIVLVWMYTFFWGCLPVFGFGSYGPEPFATSCTINWWRMKSSLNDRVYVFLILSLCFCLPTFIIISSYIAILLKVYRSSHTLAAIPSSAVTHSSKDIRLTKIAAVVCSSFLIAWMPYAIVSVYSALTAKEEHGGDAVVGTGSSHSGTSDVLTLSTLFSWASLENASSIGGSGELWNNATLDPHGQLGPRGGSGAPNMRAVSSLRPEVTLIPAMFAKSHCMFNPFIYHIMNREFREDVYYMFCGKGKKRSYSDGHRSSISLSYYHSWRRRSTPNSATHSVKEKKEKEAGHSGSMQDAPLDAAVLDTQINLEGGTGSEREREPGGSTSSSVLNGEH